MARIPPKPLSAYPWYLRGFFWLQKKKYGALLEPTLLWGRTPRVFLGFLKMFKAFERKNSPLDPQLRSLVMTKISQINDCPFCVDINSFVFLKKQGAEAKLGSLDKFQQSSLFSTKEKIGLEYAAAMTQNKVTGELFERLKKEFDDDAIVELTALIGYQNMSSKFNAALNVAAFGFCKNPHIS